GVLPRLVRLRVARDLGESGPGRGAVGEDGTDYRTVADAVRRVASEPEQIGGRFRRRDGTEVVHVGTAVVAADEAAHAFDGAVRLLEHHTHRTRLASAAPAATAVGPPAVAEHHVVAAGDHAASVAAHAGSRGEAKLDEPVSGAAHPLRDRLRRRVPGA